MTNKQNLEHFKMINRRLFIHKFCNNLKIRLSFSWVIFIRARANFSSFEYLCFSFPLIFYSFLFITQEWKQKNHVIVICCIKTNHKSPLLFVLIQQITVTLFSYSIRSYNAMNSEIQTKDNMWRIFERVFCYCQDLKMSWLEHFPKFNKRGVWIKNVLSGKFSGRGRLLETWEYVY